MDPSSPSRPPNSPLEHVTERAGLGLLHRVVSALFSSRAKMALWTDPNWTTDSSPLTAALLADQTIGFAFVLAGSSPGLEARQCRIHTRPTDVPAIVVRPQALLSIKLPDLGLPDSILDAAAGWALASILTLSGCHGRVIHDPNARRSGVRPESIHALSPVGTAWLITQSQSWAKQSTTVRPERQSSLVADSMSEAKGLVAMGAGMGVGR